MFEATNETKHLAVSGFYYDLESPCYYTIYGDFVYGSLSQPLEITV
jgi:hypothetical protein